MNSSTIVDLIGPFLEYDTMYELRKIDTTAYTVVIDMIKVICKSVNKLLMSSNVSIYTTNQKRIYVYRKNRLLCKSLYHDAKNAINMFGGITIYYDTDSGLALYLDGSFKNISLSRTFKNISGVKSVSSSVSWNSFLDLNVQRCPNNVILTHNYFIMYYGNNSFEIYN